MVVSWSLKAHQTWKEIPIGTGASKILCLIAELILQCDLNQNRMSALWHLVHQNPILFGLILGLLGLLLYSLINNSAKPPKDKTEVVSRATDRSKVYSREEIAQHNKPNDLWLIVCDRVYDITSFVPFHPGGELLLRNAGGDSTLGFFGIQHPERVFWQIHDYQIGKLAYHEHARWFYNGDEINKHTTSGDAWIVIGDRVYNVTKWADKHPGGAEILLRHSGLAKSKEAEELFKKHKKEDQDKAQAYFIGFYVSEKDHLALKERTKEFYIAQQKMEDFPESNLQNTEN